MVWIAASAMAVAVAVLLASALMRGRGGTGTAEASLGVYRDQMREVDRDIARGVIGTEEAARLRAEIGHRALEADRGGGEGGGATGPRLGAALAVAAVTVAGGVLLYARLGAPGYPDMPLEARIAMAEALRAERPSQAEAEAQFPPPPPPEGDPAYLDLVARLREQVALRPSDLRGHELLAQSEARLGDFAAAHVAQARVIAIKGDDATAEDHVALADLMVTATRGYVSPEAEAALAEALRRDPGNGLARYYSGLMLAQTGRPDLAFRLWRPLVEDSPPGAPWTAALRDQVGEAAALAGVDYDLPPLPAALPGPDADALDAAGALSPEERAEMVAGMVGRLARRLAEDGGTAEEWARLIRAQGVLGNLDAARTVWAEAQAAFAGRDADLALLRDAARAAGVAE